PRRPARARSLVGGGDRRGQHAVVVDPGARIQQDRGLALLDLLGRALAQSTCLRTDIQGRATVEGVDEAAGAGTFALETGLPDPLRVLRTELRGHGPVE